MSMMGRRADNRRYVVVPNTYVLAAVLAGLELAIVLYFSAVAHDLRSMTIDPIVPEPSASHPDPAFYCNGVKGLETAKLLDSQAVAMIVNAAPTWQAHDAGFTLYRHLQLDAWTTSDIAAMAAAYQCPAT
jgi:hypothetical protein